MINIKQLNLKGKLLLLNEIKSQAEATIKMYKETVKPEVAEAENTTIEVAEVGHLKLTSNSTTTVENLIKKRLEDIAKIQKEIEDLKLLDKNDIIITRQGSLNCYTTNETKQLANDLLKDLIENDLNSKALKNKAQKVSRIK